MRGCILHTSPFTMTSFMFATLLLMFHAASHVTAYSLISSETSPEIGEITDITNEIHEITYVGSEERVEEIVDSLLRLVVYFEDNLDIITVDCLFGLRIAQGNNRISLSTFIFIYIDILRLSKSVQSLSKSISKVCNNILNTKKTNHASVPIKAI